MPGKIGCLAEITQTLSSLKVIQLQVPSYVREGGWRARRRCCDGNRGWRGALLEEVLELGECRWSPKAGEEARKWLLSERASRRNLACLQFYLILVKFILDIQPPE